MAFENLNRRYRYFVTFLKLPPKCTSLQVSKSSFENCTLLQVEITKIYSSKVTIKQMYFVMYILTQGEGDIQRVEKISRPF